MKVKCIADRFSESMLALGVLPPLYSVNTHIPLNIGEIYYVMGIIVSKKVVNYVIHFFDMPLELPNILFDVIDPEIPNDWYFNIEKDTQITFIGYKEFVLDNNHWNDLVEGKDSAMSIYNSYKKKYLVDT